MSSVEALLARLDSPPAARPAATGDVQVRLVWLVNGLAREDAPPLPDDLKEVLPGLAKLGIDKPRLAAQTLVNVTPNTEFVAQGVAKLDGPCQFVATGRFNDKKETPGLTINIRAARI